MQNYERTTADQAPDEDAWTSGRELQGADTGPTGESTSVEDRSVHLLHTHPSSALVHNEPSDLEEFETREALETEHLLSQAERADSTGQGSPAVEGALNHQQDQHGISSTNASGPSNTRPSPVSWSSLPKKGQLAVLTLARLSEPLTQTSLQSYMYYQLKSFHDTNNVPPSDATVARQVGLLAASFTGAQFMTAMLWGRMADSKHMGRKRVIMIGLLGTAIGSLGFGFSTSFYAAVFWRSIGGMLNGNVAVMRTMISEIVREKKYQSRAFLLMPMTFNIGVIIGPLLGGLLADPVRNYPSLFGPGSLFGGDEGVGWMVRSPYALPNVVTAMFLLCSTMGIVFGLEETLEDLKDRPDYGIRFRRWLMRTVTRRRAHSDPEYAMGARNGDGDADDADAADIDLEADRVPRRTKTKLRQKLPIRRMFTANVITTLMCHGLLASHVGTFSFLWFMFLSTPRYDATGDNASLKLPSGYHPIPPLIFSGGLALPPPSIGTALAILGVIGISLQLLLYPRLSFRLGTIASYHYATILFPIAYTLVPFLALLPSSTPPPTPASGPVVWLGITGVLCVQVMARTFALPSMTILVNNASPHPSVLGTMHGLAQSASSAARTLGPAIMGWVYGLGISQGVVGLAWWCMAFVAVVGAVAGRFVREGDGHEVLLQGEDEDEDKL